MRCTFIRAVIRRALQGKTESPKLEKKNNIEHKSVDRLRVSNSRGNFCELLVLNQTEETGLTKRNGSENILLDRFSHPVGGAPYSQDLSSTLAMSGLSAL